jgi:hypothetical protein
MARGRGWASRWSLARAAGRQGTLTVEQAAREPVRVALIDANGPTGTFSNEDGALP